MVIPCVWILPTWLEMEGSLRVACANKQFADRLRPVLDSKRYVMERLRMEWMRPIPRENIPGHRCGIPQEMWSDYDVVLLAVMLCPISIQYAAPELKRNLHIARIAVRHNADAWYHVHEDVKHDFEVAFYSYQWF